MTRKQKRVLCRIIVSAVGTVLLHLIPLPHLPKSILSLAVYFLIGYDILRKAFTGMRRRRMFDENFLMALATVDEKGIPWVRTIDAIFYEDSFYTITYALSNKMKQIEKNATVAISGEWFSGHGVGENLGHVNSEQNKEIADKYNLSIHTVITHRKNITRKTGIKTVAGLTVYALLNNLIDPNSIE